MKKTGRPNQNYDNIKMKYLLLILIFLFFSCHPQSEYVLIKDNLYRDNKNNLYIKTIDNVSESNPKPKYISELYLLEKEDPTPISQIVDRTPYHQIEKTNYSKDKKYVYFLRETLEGGFFMYWSLFLIILVF
ncbi:hypothetical protein EGI16_19280 [Chryseobacterium sp. G0240]|nr:hypothetical protein EGI16_19280 [Chryseobacterium sp. G0240]